MEDLQIGPRIRKSVVLVEVMGSVGPGVFRCLPLCLVVLCWSGPFRGRGVSPIMSIMFNRTMFALDDRTGSSQPTVV